MATLNKEFFTVNELAERWGIHRRSVVRMYMGFQVKNPDGSTTRKRPVIAPTRIRGSVRIFRYEVERYEAQHTGVVEVRL
jgi:hypothetical protein